MRELADSVGVTSTMIGGLPVDMPTSYEDTTEFIAKNGDMVRSVSKVVADYEFDTLSRKPPVLDRRFGEQKGL